MRAISEEHRDTPSSLHGEVSITTADSGDLDADAIENIQVENRIAETRRLLDPEGTLPKVTPSRKDAPDSLLDSYTVYANFEGKETDIGYLDIEFDRKNEWNNAVGIAIERKPGYGNKAMAPVFI